MKVGLRDPSLKKQLAARNSPARWLRGSYDFKAPGVSR